MWHVWWDNLSYLYNEFHIILIQLLWPTPLSYLVFNLCLSIQQLQWSDLSTANNYTFTETEWQKLFCNHDPSSEQEMSVFNSTRPQRRVRTRHKDMSGLKSPVCDIMSSSESKGNFIPKTKIIFSLNLLEQFLWFFGNFKGWEHLASNTFEQ